jgi:hypothetical protein
MFMDLNKQNLSSASLGLNVFVGMYKKGKFAICLK